MYRALRARIGDFDIVEIHGLYRFHTLVGGAIARRRHIPYIIQPHGTLDRYRRARHRWRKALYRTVVERRNLRGAAAIHYTTKQERDEAEETGVPAPGHVVPMGSTWTRIAGRRPRRSFLPGSPATVPLITFMGRLAEKKGLDVVVDALAVVTRMGGRAQLVIAGPDDEGLQASLERRDRVVSARGLRYVHRNGDGSPEDGAPPRSRAFVLPSHDENFGIAVLEAMAAGAPVIVSRGVAIYPDVEAAGAGLVIDRSSEAHTPTRSSDYCRNSTAQQLMGGAAMNLAARRFSLETMGEGLEAPCTVLPPTWTASRHESH